MLVSRIQIFPTNNNNDDDDDNNNVSRELCPELVISPLFAQGNTYFVCYVGWFILRYFGVFVADDNKILE